MLQHPVVIVGAKRTPIGNFLGCFKSLSAPQLASTAIKAALEQAAVKVEAIDEAIIGCVLTAGIGQAPARQAALGAGLLPSTGCVTINKVCGSGLKAIMFAHDLIFANHQKIILAGGMESMTNAPYLLPKARQGYRIGHGELTDHLVYDGLEDAYHKGQVMGLFAEATAKKFGYSREQQDAYAITSVERAQQAIQSGICAKETTPVHVMSRSGESEVINTDEGPLTANIAKIPQLRPAFSQDGTITAANSSSISDGAAAVILTSAAHAKQYQLQPLAQIVGFTTHAQEPEWFTTAPIGAIQKLLTQLNWSVADVDLFEINEAFSVVVMAAMQQLSIPHNKVNVHGGACVLGHPIGASGARLIVTLLNALQVQQKHRGIAALCLGGGEAVAMAIERIQSRITFQWQK